MKEKIFKKSPLFVQNILVSIFNILAYKNRYGGNYSKYLKHYKNYRNASLKELKQEQLKRLHEFSIYVLKHSLFYKELYGSSITSINLDNIGNLPLVVKADLQSHYDTIRTINIKNGIKSKTGGTTGKSLEVVFTKDNMQERFAILDTFRGQFGYSLGKRTAWFSGKNIVFEKDVKNKRFWKTDYFHNIRYYSSFHIKNEYLAYYIKNLISFKPEFIAGFPSTILELAQYGLAHNISFPANTIKAIFLTAEIITPTMRKTFELFFKTKVYDQYASSEGAPFIFECKNQNLHLQLQTGIFEVLDEHNNPANEGKLVVTSFTTCGTPLIRYDIGDSVTLSDKVCNCGDKNPIVNRILGREGDFIYSVEMGKVSSGNISNTLKDVKGVQKFQVIQNGINEISIILIADKAYFKSNDEVLFLEKWRARVGYKMKIIISYVLEIPNESNGKFKMIKNNIKHLIE
ncbi:MAG: phenylacetate-CoA ligase [Polaribacter sp.]